MHHEARLSRTGRHKSPAANGLFSIVNAAFGQRSPQVWYRQEIRQAMICMLSGTLPIDARVDIDRLPAFLTSCLNHVRATSVAAESQRITFRGGMFRWVSNWNVLVQFDRGVLEIDPITRQLHFRLSVRQLVIAVTALMLAGLAIALSQGNDPSIALPFAAIWLWLAGGNLLIGYPRFRRFIKRALAEASRA
jgi:hypothetical protein